MNDGYKGHTWDLFFMATDESLCLYVSYGLCGYVVNVVNIHYITTQIMTHIIKLVIPPYTKDKWNANGMITIIVEHLQTSTFEYLLSCFR